MNPDQQKEIGLIYLKSLQSPRDIINAALDLSRDFNGNILLRLESKNHSDKVFYFNPQWMQTERDTPGSHDNTHVKLFGLIDTYKLGITNVEKVEPKRLPKKQGGGMESSGGASIRILEKRGYEQDKDQTIVGLFSKSK